MKAYAEEALVLLGDLDETELANDRVRFLALTRAAEVVGEAAAQVSDAVRRRFQTIEFGSAVAMRHRLIHGYGSVSARVLVNTVRHDFPGLIASLAVALSEPLPDENH
jgi:uncharacterized protein with HEPN domain